MAIGEARRPRKGGRAVWVEDRINRNRAKEGQDEEVEKEGRRWGNRILFIPGSAVR